VAVVNHAPQLPIALHNASCIWYYLFIYIYIIFISYPVSKVLAECRQVGRRFVRKCQQIDINCGPKKSSRM